MYASIQDIQSWLPADKVEVDDANSAKPNLDAYRLIRAQLTGTFTVAAMNVWDSPDNTPEMIRSIAGRLAAAFLYRNLYSEESEDIAKYAQGLYNEAISMLADIKTGTLTVVDSGGDPVDATGANTLSFFDTTPVFSIGQEFA